LRAIPDPGADRSGRDSGFEGFRSFHGFLNGNLAIGSGERVTLRRRLEFSPQSIFFIREPNLTLIGGDSPEI
jgi:hypothetical protein